MLFQDWRQGSPHYRILVANFIIALHLSAGSNTPDYLHLLMLFPYQTVLSSFSLQCWGTGVPRVSSLALLYSIRFGRRVHFPHLGNTPSNQSSSSVSPELRLHLKLHTWMFCWIWDLSTCKTKVMVSPSSLFLLCSLSESTTSLSGQAPVRSLQVICDHPLSLIHAFHLLLSPIRVHAWNVCHNKGQQIGFI